MTIRQAVIRATQKLRNHNLPEAQADAEFLLSEVLKKDLSAIYLHPDKKLSSSQQRKYDKYIVERKKRQPIAYIVKQKHFFNHSFYLDKNVLIPRPETEILVTESEKVINSFKQRINVFDIGTGSGIVGLSLAKLCPKARLYATDTSEKALKVARLNAKKLNLAKKIRFFKGSLLKPIRNHKIDIIIANLPYLTRKEMQTIEKGSELISFEPAEALSGGKNGLEIYKKLIQQIAHLRSLPKYLLIEIGHDQKNPLIKFLKQYFNLSTVSVIKDINNKDRILKVQFRNKKRG